MNLHTLSTTRPQNLFESAATAPESTPPMLSEPTLFYNPPYDTRVDDSIAWHLVRFLDPSCGLHYRVPVLDDDVSIRPIDFVIEKGGRRIGLDVLGEDEEDPDRDTLAIGSGAVDVLYQVQADDVEERRHDALFLLYRWEPSLFEDDALSTLNELVSDAARQAALHPERDALRARYIHESTIDGERITWPGADELVVERKALEHIIPHLDSALRRYQLTLSTVTGRYERCA